MTDRPRFETAAIHAGQDPDPATGAAVVPIYATSTYVQDAAGPGDVPRRAGGCPGGDRVRLRDGGDHHAGDDAPRRRPRADTRRRVRGTFRLFDKVTRNLGLDYAMVDM